MQQEHSAAGNLFFNNKENEQHTRAIERLAHDLNLPFETVQQSYTEILEGLRQAAKVKTFLPVLVSRGVKERLQQK